MRKLFQRAQVLPASTRRASRARVYHREEHRLRNLRGGALSCLAAPRRANSEWSRWMSITKRGDEKSKGKGGRELRRRGKGGNWTLPTAWFHARERSRGKRTILPDSRLLRWALYYSTPVWTLESMRNLQYFNLEIWQRCERTRSRTSNVHTRTEGRRTSSRRMDERTNRQTRDFMWAERLNGARRIKTWEI